MGKDSCESEEKETNWMGLAAEKLFEFERFIAKKNVSPGENVKLYDTITSTPSSLMVNHTHRPIGFWCIHCLQISAVIHRCGWSFESV